MVAARFGGCNGADFAAGFRSVHLARPPGLRFRRSGKSTAAAKDSVPPKLWYNGAYATALSSLLYRHPSLGSKMKLNGWPHPAQGLARQGFSLDSAMGRENGNGVEWGRTAVFAVR